MNSGTTVFAQLMDYLPTYEFQTCVNRYSGAYRSFFAPTNAWPLTFWAKAGTPITYAVPSTNGNPTGSTYEAFLTLEQLM